MENILDKFLRYISFDTASDPTSETQPSTAKQFALLKVLLEELHQMDPEISAMEIGEVLPESPRRIYIE